MPPVLPREGLRLLCSHQSHICQACGRIYCLALASLLSCSFACSPRQGSVPLFFFSIKPLSSQRRKRGSSSTRLPPFSLSFFSDFSLIPTCNCNTFLLISHFFFLPSSPFPLFPSRASLSLLSLSLTANIENIDLTPERALSARAAKSKWSLLGWARAAPCDGQCPLGPPCSAAPA